MTTTTYSDGTYKKTINGKQYEFLVYTRCVYDVWYWGDEKDSFHLTSWGGYQMD